MKLTSEQQQWYMLTDTAVPHVTLAVNKTDGYQAKDVGHMIKQLATDFRVTDILGLMKNKDGDLKISTRVTVPYTVEKSLIGN